MNWNPILALLAFAYSALVLYIVIKKPANLMKVGKYEMVEKMFGEKGANIFYYVGSVIFAAIGIWLLVK